MTWSSEDQLQISQQGTSIEEVEEHLRLHREPPPPTRLRRACTVNDGVLQIPNDQHDVLLKLFERGAAAGRFTKFTPASGAASRMFQQLTQLLTDPDSKNSDGQRFVAELDRFAFASALRNAAPDDDTQTLLSTLLGPGGLGFASLPKALIPFHQYPESSRTAAEEHLWEATQIVRDNDGACRIHFTVPTTREDMFRSFVDNLALPLGQDLGAHFDLSYSTQSTATDTLAATPEGSPFRTDDGRLLFRPGGHGSLIGNLADLGADLVFIKNIDNILPDHGQPLVVHWKKLLGGLLLRLERRALEILELCQSADDGPWLDEALKFVDEQIMSPSAREFFKATAEDKRTFLLDRLDRPMRICGVVLNSGEPGGGPFWVDSNGEESLQIVETSQIDRSDPDQARILETATHFNPVDLVCRVRSHLGKAYDLHQFVDPQTAFVCSKSYAGRSLTALERPGLWNGAMAHWNTVFVEVPAATFAPVKTVFDLLSPQHQPQV